MDKTELGLRIRTLRENKGMKQNALANKAGVSPTYIYQLERGEKSPTVEYLEYICEALGITLADFFSDSPQNKVNYVDNLSSEQLSLLNAFLHSINDLKY